MNGCEIVEAEGASCGSDLGVFADARGGEAGKVVAR